MASKAVFFFRGSTCQEKLQLLPCATFDFHCQHLNFARFARIFQKKSWYPKAKQFVIVKVEPDGHPSINVFLNWMIHNLPRTPMSSIFEGQPSKTRPFPNKTRGPIWVLGLYIYIYIYRKWLLFTKHPNENRLVIWSSR